MKRHASIPHGQSIYKGEMKSDMKNEMNAISLLARLPTYLPQIMLLRRGNKVNVEKIVNNIGSSARDVVRVLKTIQQNI